MATAYKATSVGKPTAPVLFDPDPTQQMGQLNTLIGYPVAGLIDGSTLVNPQPQRLGGAPYPVVIDTDGNCNTP